LPVDVHLQCRPEPRPFQPHSGAVLVLNRSRNIDDVRARVLLCSSQEERIRHNSGSVAQTESRMHVGRTAHCLSASNKQLSRRAGPTKMSYQFDVFRIFVHCIVIY
jgi:hypothetical protein